MRRFQNSADLIRSAVSVWSPYERRLAIEDTLDVVGVVRLEDLLRIFPELREDRAVHDDVRFEMGLDSVLNSRNLVWCVINSFPLFVIPGLPRNPVFPGKSVISPE